MKWIDLIPDKDWKKLNFIKKSFLVKIQKEDLCDLYFTDYIKDAKVKNLQDQLKELRG